MCVTSSLVELLFLLVFTFGRGLWFEIAMSFLGVRVVVVCGVGGRESFWVPAAHQEAQDGLRIGLHLGGRKTFAKSSYNGSGSFIQREITIKLCFTIIS